MAEKFIQHSTNHNSNPFFSHSGAPSEIPLPTNKDSWLAVVHAMSEQNQHFRKQQSWIQVQMVKLSKLSQNLIIENEQLRSLYKGRTQDITRFLTTMAINTNEITGEHEHRQFLLKELNYFILKQIKADSKISEDLSQSIKEKQQKANQLNQLRMKMQQQDLGQLKVKIRVDFKSNQLKDIKSKQLEQIQAANLLEGSVYELIIQNKSLQDEIYQLLNEKKRDYAHIQEEKRQYENNYASIMIENKKYKNQILKDKNDLQKVQASLASKKEKHSLTVKNLGEQIRNYEQNQQRNQQLLNQKSKLKSKIEQVRNRVNSSETKLEEQSLKKQQILEKIKAVKNQMRQLQRNKNKALDEILFTKIDKIQVLNGIHRKNQVKSSQQLQLILKQQSKADEIKNKNTQEQQSLRQKNDMYKNLIKTIGNPVKQIEKIELMSRLRKYR